MSKAGSVAVKRDGMPAEGEVASRAEAVRAQIEAAAGGRFAGALTPAPREVRELAPTGIEALDAMLGGGAPVGAITELVGPLCSGRTGVALSTMAAAMREGSMCAWVDASDAFDPESAAANGVCLEQLLWVRCGAQAVCGEAVAGRASGEARGRVAAGARGGQHPREEVRGMDRAVGELLGASSGRGRDRSIGTPGAANRALVEGAPRCHPPERGDGPRRGNGAVFASVPRDEQVSTDRQPKRGRNGGEAYVGQGASERPGSGEDERAVRVRGVPGRAGSGKPWGRLDQALRAADLLLQAGGFRVLVLDLGSVPEEYALKIPLASWFRFRAAADQGRTVLLALTQASCAKSSAGLVVRFGALEPQGSVASAGWLMRSPGDGVAGSEGQILESIRYHAQRVRQRFNGGPQPVTVMDERRMGVVRAGGERLGGGRRPPQATWQMSAYPVREA